MTITRRALMRNAALAGAIGALGNRAFAASTVRWDMADEYNADALSGAAEQRNMMLAEVRRRLLGV